MKYIVPKFDFSTAAGAAEALKNPNFSVRYLAFTALKKMGKTGHPGPGQALRRQVEPAHPRSGCVAVGPDRRRRPDCGGRGHQRRRSRHSHHRRSSGPRAETRPDQSRASNWSAIPIRPCGASAPSPCVTARPPEAAELWAELAAQHDGQDRWYLEALGIGADQNWDASWTPIWPRPATSGTRPPDATSSGAAVPKTPELLVKIIKDPSTTKEDQPRYLRAFDFQAKSPEKEKALEDLLELE